MNILEALFILFTFFVIGQVTFIGVKFFRERKDEISSRHWVHVFLNSMGSALLCLYVAIDQLQEGSGHDGRRYPWWFTALGLTGVILLNSGLVKLYAKGHLDPQAE